MPLGARNILSCLLLFVMFLTIVHDFTPHEHHEHSHHGKADAHTLIHSHSEEHHHTDVHTAHKKQTEKDNLFDFLLNHHIHSSFFHPSGSFQTPETPTVSLPDFGATFIYTARHHLSDTTGLLYHRIHIDSPPIPPPCLSVYLDRGPPLHV